MSVLRLTKKFHFEMAHALYNYNGKCRNIHGHSYELHVTIRGNIKSLAGSSEDGMVMDFSDIKKIIEENIIKTYDHALVLNDIEKDNYRNNKNINIIYLPFQPTCENLVCYFVNIIKSKLKNGIELYSLKLYETSTSYVEWNIEDNNI